MYTISRLKCHTIAYRLPLHVVPARVFAVRSVVMVMVVHYQLHRVRADLAGRVPRDALVASPVTVPRVLNHECAVI